MPRSARRTPRCKARLTARENNDHRGRLGRNFSSMSPSRRGGRKFTPRCRSAALLFVVLERSSIAKGTRMTAAARFAAKPVAQREITITRTFDAPRALVFSMFTDAKHLAAWWGPHGWSNPKAEADPRAGGKILINMQAPDGTVHPMGGMFNEIVSHVRIVFTTFVDIGGTRALEARNTVTFTDEGGRTK